MFADQQSKSRSKNASDISSQLFFENLEYGPQPGTFGFI
jgi:hypothetical protein